MVTLAPASFAVRATPATKPVRPLRAPLDRPRMSMGAFTALDVMLTMRPKPRAAMPSTVALMINRRQHVASTAFIHASSIPNLAEVSHGRAARVGDDDLVPPRSRTPGPTFSVVMSTATCCTAVSAGRNASAELCHHRCQRFRSPRHEHDVDAFAHRRLRAAKTQALLPPHQRPFARNTQIHTVPLMLGKSRS